MLHVRKYNLLYQCYVRLSTVWCNFIYMVFLNLTLLLSLGYLYAKHSMLPSNFNTTGKDQDQISGFTKIKIYLVS